MSRVQLALNVDDLDPAVEFYSKLFATEPAKVRPGYANFAIAEPPLKLVLIEGDGAPAARSTTSASRSSRPTRSPPRSTPAARVSPRPKTRSRVATRSRTRCGSTARRASRGRSTRCSPTSRCRAANSAPSIPRPARRAARSSRTSRRRRNALLLRTVRRRSSSPSVWRSRDVARRAEWTVRRSTPAERAEIVRAVGRARPSGRRVHAAPRRLPVAEPRGAHRRVVDDAAPGRGFVLVRGFPVDELEPDDVELAYVGLGLHLGTPVSQDAEGTLLGHVRDRGRAAHRPRSSAVRHHRTSGLPHRRRRHHRVALPAGREARRRESHRRARPPSTTRSCGATRICSTSSTSRCTGTATASNRPAKTRSSGCRSSTTSTGAHASSTSAGTSATRSGTRTCRGSPATSAPRWI